MSKQKQKGTAFETLCLPLIKEYYPHAERRPAQGSKDKGDYYLPGEDRFILEAKNVTRFNLPEWMREAEREAKEAGAKHGVVLSKRRGSAKAGEQWIHMSLAAFLDLVKPTSK